MKVLRLDMAFKLPDDFSGDFNDALMEIVKYRKSRDLTTLKGGAKSTISAAKYGKTKSDLVYKEFLSVVEKGYSLHGVIFSKFRRTGNK